jgi:putative FmdB family regulatory protein
MPLYDYQCAACRRRFEVVHGVHADGPTTCPLCGKGPVRKAISAAAVHYKGSGWAKKERRATVKSGSSKPTGDDNSTSDSSSSSDAAPASDSKDSGSAPPAAPKTAASGATKTTD